MALCFTLYALVLYQIRVLQFFPLQFTRFVHKLPTPRARRSCPVFSGVFMAPGFACKCVAHPDLLACAVEAKVLSSFPLWV